MRFFIFLKNPPFCTLLDYSGELLNFSRYAFGGACACDLQYRTLAMHPSVLHAARMPHTWEARAGEGALASGTWRIGFMGHLAAMSRRVNR